MELLYFSQQLAFIRWIQEFRSPGLDSFFWGLSFFDRQEFLFVLVPIIAWFCDRNKGLQIFFLVLFNSYLNTALKRLFHMPRPLAFDEGLGLITVDQSYGFPSGAAQTAFLLSALWVSAFPRNRWVWGLAGSYLFLVSLSRLYLGVHFPMDIVGGWFFGALLFGVYRILLARPTSISRGWIIVLGSGITLGLAGLIATASTLKLAGASLGALASLWIDVPDASRTAKESAIGVFVTIMGLFLICRIGSFLSGKETLIGKTAPFFVISLWVFAFSKLLLRKRAG